MVFILNRYTQWATLYPCMSHAYIPIVVRVLHSSAFIWSIDTQIIHVALNMLYAAELSWVKWQYLRTDGVWPKSLWKPCITLAIIHGWKFLYCQVNHEIMKPSTQWKSTGAKHTGDECKEWSLNFPHLSKEWLVSCHYKIPHPWSYT